VQLSSEPVFGEVVMKFMNKEVGEELSPAASEVLAVIAYRGPLTRAEIEYIRGVNCSFTLRNLAIRGLVDRKENPSDSRSYLYEISFEFMNSLGIKTVQELPGYKDLIKKEKEQSNEIEDKN
jgi:segregation and condensation protein B|nr:SMC-Scp complex subunit ScpB [Patescibacteria group bacterium]